MSKVEEVAGAACEYLSTVEGVEVAYDGNGSSVYLLCDDGQDAKPVKVCVDLEQFARAAIEALRVPTPDMIVAGDEANPTEWNDETDPGFAQDVAQAVWGGMLDAALNEGDENG